MLHQKIITKIQNHLWKEDNWKYMKMISNAGSNLDYPVSTLLYILKVIFKTIAIKTMHKETEGQW